MAPVRPAEEAPVVVKSAPQPKGKAPESLKSPHRSRVPTVSSYMSSSPLNLITPPVRKRSNSNEDPGIQPTPAQPTPAEPKVIQPVKMVLKKAAPKVPVKMDVAPAAQKLDSPKPDPVTKPAPDSDSGYLSALELLLGTNASAPIGVTPRSENTSTPRSENKEPTTPHKIAAPVRPIEVPKNLPPGLAALSAEDYAFLKQEVMKMFHAELSKTKSEILQQIHQN